MKAPIPIPEESIRNLSPASIRAMAAADLFSQQLGWGMLVSEGLLAGLNEIEDGVTHAMLDYYDLGNRATLIETMAEDLGRSEGSLPAAIPATVTLDELMQRSYSDNMVSILKQALEISRQQSAGQIQEYHLLYGILATESCQATTWLKGKSLLVEAIRTALKDLRIDQKVQVDRFGTRLEVVRIERGWRLPLDALVLPLKVDNGSLGGEFYRELLSHLASDVAPDLESHLQSIYANLPAPDRPDLATLPVDLGWQVLPFPRQDRPRILYFGPSEPPHAAGSKAGADGALVEPHVVAQELVGRIAETDPSRKIRRIALPVVSGEPVAQDTAEPRAEIAAEPILDELLRRTDLGGLQVITLLTYDPAVVRMAHEKFNRYINNRAQRLLNDEPRGRDLLGIAPEIYALAETLMLRDVEPPLAVGVIGGWGSGKSFVMHLMQERMKQIRALPVTKGWDGDETEPYVGHVYPISFNAWTYAKSDLWASLIHTILFDLDRQLSLEKLFEGEQMMQGGAEWLELNELGEEARQALLAPLGEEVVTQWQQGEVKGRLWEAYRRLREDELKKLAEDEKALDDEQDALKQAEKAYEETCKAIPENAYKNVWQQLLETLIVGPVAKELKRRLKEQFSEEDLADLHAFEVKLRALQPTLNRLPQLLKERRGEVVAVVSLTALAVCSAIVGDLLVGWTRTATMTSILAFVGSAGTALAAAFRTYQQWRETIGGVLSAVEGKLDAEMTKLEKKAQDEFDPIRQERGNEIDKLQQQIDLRKERIGVTGQFSSLSEFVSSRLEMGDYEARLGLLHQIQADLQEMTEALVVGRDDLDLHAEAKKEFFPRGPARVVLFIDDLDRCPPHKVVEVLEAVQLLLRTQLFVVVLAIDTRYITRALEKRYKEILIHQGDPSGLDYIEKIIQIPYRIRPAKSSHLDTYLQEQMAITGVREVSGESEPQGPGTEGRTGEGRATGELGAPTPPAEGADELETLPPEVVAFNWDDYDDTLACSRQVSLTPRSVKRLLNVFKLIKIFWFRSLGGDEERPVKKTVAGLLALSAGYPEVMREVFVRLEVAYHNPEDADKKIAGLLIEFKLAGALPAEYKWQLERFRADVKSLSKAPLQFFDVTVRRLLPDTLNLVRSFSFVGDPSYEIESEEPAPASVNVGAGSLPNPETAVNLDQQPEGSQQGGKSAGPDLSDG